MFKIVRTAKQIFSAARNLGQKASVSISSGLKYCTQSKGYVEDASGEFTFEKIVSNQSLTQDKMNSFNTVCPNIAKPQSIDWHAIRKLIYARFADEIVSKSSKHLVGVWNIADEFKELREQGYNFKELRNFIINHNSSEAFKGDSSNNKSNSKSLSDRMKDLSISGYISSYSGEPCLREEIEAVSFKKELVINEFMNTFVDEVEAQSAQLLG